MEITTRRMTLKICHNDSSHHDDGENSLVHDDDGHHHQCSLSNQTFYTALVTRIFMYYLYPNKHYCSNEIAFFASEIHKSSTFWHPLLMVEWYRRGRGGSLFNLFSQGVGAARFRKFPLFMIQQMCFLKWRFCCRSRVGWWTQNWQEVNLALAFLLKFTNPIYVMAMFLSVPHALYFHDLSRLCWFVWQAVGQISLGPHSALPWQKSGWYHLLGLQNIHSHLRC